MISSPIIPFREGPVNPPFIALRHTGQWPRIRAEPFAARRRLAGIIAAAWCSRRCVTSWLNACLAGVAPTPAAVASAAAALLPNGVNGVLPYEDCCGTPITPSQSVSDHSLPLFCDSIVSKMHWPQNTWPHGVTHMFLGGLRQIGQVYVDRRVSLGVTRARAVFARCIASRAAWMRCFLMLSADCGARAGGVCVAVSVASVAPSALVVFALAGAVLARTNSTSLSPPSSSLTTITGPWSPPLNCIDSWSLGMTVEVKPWPCAYMHLPCICFVIPSTQRASSVETGGLGG